MSFITVRLKRKLEELAMTAPTPSPREIIRTCIKRAFEANSTPEEDWGIIADLAAHGYNIAQPLVLPVQLDDEDVALLSQPNGTALLITKLVKEIDRLRGQLDEAYEG